MRMRIVDIQLNSPNTLTNHRLAKVPYLTALVEGLGTEAAVELVVIAVGLDK